jgi:hypothetical protein
MLAFSASSSLADKLVLGDGRILFGTITNEKDSLIKYFDRFERPRKIAAKLVDTIHYDSKGVPGLVKVAFRKGQPQDRSGYFRLRHSEELDLDVEYHTDSVSELDLFFRNDVHVRILSNSRFRVSKAPRSIGGTLELTLYTGRLLATSANSDALARIITPWGIAVGRANFQAGVIVSSTDSSLLAMCRQGLVGVQESTDSPGELVVEKGKAISIFKKDGLFNRREPDPEAEKVLINLASNMGHYQFSAVEYPKIGYLPKAITGLGFMVFFYGTAIGILDYVNHI